MTTEETSMEDDATIVAANNEDTVPTEITTTRITLTLTVVGKDKSRQDTLQQIRDFLTYSQRADPHIRILPWYSSGNQLPLVSADDVPTDFNLLQVYCPRLNPRMNLQKQRVYASVHLQHSDSLITLKQNLAVWLGDKGHMIYPKDLQYEKTVDAGFLCWSTRSMDKEVLAAEIRDDTGVDCALVWKVIYSGKKDIPDNEKVRALHVHINAVGQQHAFERLSNRYGTSNNGFPKNRKMRFYPTWFRVHSEQSREKLRKAILRQKSFCNVVRDDRCADIASLDTSSNGLPSLRELVGKIMSHKYPTLPLFVSADHHFYDNGGIVFQFMPHLADEAIMMMHNLLPYFRHLHGEAVEQYFLPEAVQASRSLEWDEDNHCVLCPTDENMATAEDVDPFGLEDARSFVNEEMKQAAEAAKTVLAQDARPLPKDNPGPSASEIPRHEAGAYYKDTDSISTLGNSIQQAPTSSTTGPAGSSTPSSVPHTLTKTAPSSVFVPVATDAPSVTSGVTMESFQKIVQEQQRTKDVLDAILARLPPLPNSQSGGNLGSSASGATSAGAGLS